MATKGHCSGGRRRRKCPLSKKHANILRALNQLEGKQRVVLLGNADQNLVKCLCECALNILRGNVPLKPGEKNRLRKHAKLLRLLSVKRKNNNFRGKKKLLLQHGAGGFLPALLAPIIAAVVNKFLLK